MTSALEKAAQYGPVWSAIFQAIKTAKEMTNKNKQLAQTIELTQRQADELDKLHIMESEELESLNLTERVQELKTIAQRIAKSGAELVVPIKDLIKEAKEFEMMVNSLGTITGTLSTVSPEFLAKFCDALDSLCKRAMTFSDQFTLLTENLAKMEQKTEEIADSMRGKMEELTRSTELARKTAIGIAALVALGFFTGGAAWVAAIGVACGAELAGVDFTKLSTLSNLSKLTKEIQADVGKMDLIATELRIARENVGGELKLDKEAVKALLDALNFFNQELEKEKKEMARKKEMDMELDQTKDELAKMKAEKEELLAKLRLQEGNSSA